ncbi:MAG: hypothetical protein ACLFRG_04285 [Desulfococcaceae bacterium]
MADVHSVVAHPIHRLQCETREKIEISSGMGKRAPAVQQKNVSLPISHLLDDRRFSGQTARNAPGSARIGQEAARGVSRVKNGCLFGPDLGARASDRDECQQEKWNDPHATRHERLLMLTGRQLFSEKATPSAGSAAGRLVLEWLLYAKLDVEARAGFPKKQFD